MSNVDFLPEDYLQRKAQQRTNLLCLVLFFAVMSGVIAAFLVTEKRQRNTQALRDQINQEFAQAGKRLQKLKTMERQRATMMRKAEVTALLLERVPRSFLLAEVTNSLPAGVSLLDFELKTVIKKQPSSAQSQQSKYERRKRRKRRAATRQTEPDLPRIDPIEVHVGLTGMAGTDVQVAQFIAQLGRSDLFERIALDYSEEGKFEDELVRKFHLKMHLRPDADARDRPAHKSLFGGGTMTIKPVAIREVQP